jgi:3-hydroxybutyryl-CoA dehydrogenase
MKLIVVANVEQRQELLSKPLKEEVQWVFCEQYAEAASLSDEDPLLLLTEESVACCDPGLQGRPVFINSVVTTLQEGHFYDNFIRINGWPGFLKRPLWEIAARNETAATKILEALGWEGILVRDDPGLVAARVISMVINEAYFGLGEAISTEKEIDLAMKLGNNFPYGPLEWLEKIGIEKVYFLLKTLSQKDLRYTPAPLLSEHYFKYTDTTHGSPA